MADLITGLCLGSAAKKHITPPRSRHHPRSRTAPPTDCCAPLKTPLQLLKFRQKRHPHLHVIRAAEPTAAACAWWWPPGGPRSQRSSGTLIQPGLGHCRHYGDDHQVPPASSSSVREPETIMRWPCYVKIGNQPRRNGKLGSQALAEAVTGDARAWVWHRGQVRYRCHHDGCRLRVVRAGWAGAEAGRSARADELADQGVINA